MAKVALRQAEERTRLLVECAGLVRRMEVLDQEISRYSEWYKYHRAEEHGPAAAHMARAQQCADLEASVWRQRAHQMSYAASEHDQEAAKRLMKFELPTALREFSDEKTWLRHRLQEQDAALERMTEEVRLARGNSDSSRLAMDYVQRRAEEQKIRCEEQNATCDELVKAVANKDRELMAMRQEFRDFKSENESKLRSFSAALAEAEAAAKRELERASVEHEETRRQLREARVDSEILRKRCDGETEQLRGDCIKAQEEAKTAYKELVLVRGDLKMSQDDLEGARKGRVESEGLCQSLSGDLVQLRSDNSRLRGELQGSQEEGESMTRELKDMRLGSAHLRGELQKMQEEVETVRKELTDSQYESAHLRSELQKSREEIEAAMKKLMDSSAEGSRLRGERRNLQEEAEARVKELAGSRLDNAHLHGELQKLQEDSATTSKELEESRIGNARLRGENEATCRELHEVKEARARMQEAKDREIERLSNVVAARDAELTVVRRDLGKAVVDGEAYQAEAKSLGDSLSLRDADLAKASHELSRVLKDCQAQASHVASLEGGVRAAEGERDSLRQDAQRAMADSEAYKAQVLRQEREILTLKSERDTKEHVAASAQRRTELLAARCENLEAALSNSHSKQADFAVEMEAHKDRADKLHRALLTGPRPGLALLRGDSTAEPRSPALSRTGSVSPRTRSSAGTRHVWMPSGAGTALQQASLPPVNRPTSARIH